MVSKTILDFLKALKENNNREWFNDNRALYDSAKADFESFITVLINELSLLDKEVADLRAKDCIFRIFRDVRFAKDKSPYKPNFGAYISRGGKKLNFAGYYFHIEPGDCFVSGGVYMPSPAVLKAIRYEIFHRTDEFKAILNAPSFKKQFGGLWGEQSKITPRDFPKDFPDASLLRYKHYIAIKALTDKQLMSATLLKSAMEAYTAVIPFNRFLNNVIEDVI
jgi:uncharacterized protein (TIGR02453 family)